MMIPVGDAPRLGLFLAMADSDEFVAGGAEESERAQG